MKDVQPVAVSNPGVGTLRKLSWRIPFFLLCLMVISRFVPALWQDGPAMTWAIGAFGPTLAGLALLLVWWPLLSRASISERLLGLAGVIGSIAVSSFLLDETMKGLIPVITLPVAIAGFGVGMLITGSWLTPVRTLFGVLVCLAAGGSSALVRNEGAWGSFAFDLHWRFSPTPEQVFLADLKSRNASSDEVPSVEDGFDFESAVLWPGFRGPERNGVQPGLTIASDWSSSPPEEVWRIKVGPAWSSFAVADGYLSTQEQRGDLESVVCYASENGKEVWVRGIQARFFEALGGLGPRSTPTLSEGALYSLGAEGDLLKLDPSTGEVVWQTNLCDVAKRSPPMWGFSASPLVVQGLVVVHAGGKGDLGLLAFDVDSGALRWSSEAGEMSYGSVQDVEINGRRMLAILSDVGAELYDITSGDKLTTHDWPHSGYRALQPQIVGEDRMLIPTGMGAGTRMVQFSQVGDKLESTELWTSRRMKPDFNDIVIHDGYVYGFDNSIFACLSLSDGSLQWKGGRYGKGQALLLADSERILILSEEGELVLLETNPQAHTELARLQVLEGRTWNHPVVVGNRLYVRNASEAACYLLPVGN